LVEESYIKGDAVAEVSSACDTLQSIECDF